MLAAVATAAGAADSLAAGAGSALFWLHAESAAIAAISASFLIS
jgi:hypothetical protein